MHSLVPGEDTPVLISDDACRKRRALLDEVGMLAGRDETDLLAVVLLGDGESEASRRLPDRRLVECANRKARPGELRLGQGEKELRLVLCPIDATLQPIPTGHRIPIDLRVMSRRHRLGTETLAALHE